jgi:outer membrane protein TolC
MQCSIFQFGGHSKSIEAARELLYAANYQYNRELQTLANKVQKCYFSLDSAEGAVEAGQKNLDDAIVAYDAAYMRNQFGLTSIHDFLQAKSNKARAEFELEKAKAQVESARANLAKVIGVPVSKNLQIARSDDSDDIKDFDINIEELIRETLQVRQDILAFHSIIKSKKNFVQKSESKFLPEFVIGGSGSRKRFHHEGGHFDNFDIYAALKWTVFDGFGNVYDLAESRAELKRAEEEFRQLRLNVASEVWEKYHSFKSAVRQLRAARNYEQAANESFDATVMAYSSGLSSFGDLMASQTQSASARQQTVASKNNLYIAVVDLLYAVGMEIFEPIRSEDNE